MILSTNINWGIIKDNKGKICENIANKTLGINLVNIQQNENRYKHDEITWILT